jgi:hypothetical protein
MKKSDRSVGGFSLGIFGPYDRVANDPNVDIGVGSVSGP